MQAIRQRVLMLEATRQVRFAERFLPLPGPDDVVVRTRYSTFKHGTEMLAFSGHSPFATQAFNPDLRLFEPASAPRDFYPRPMGNMAVGVVEGVGGNARTLRPDQTVYAWVPIADVHVLPASKVYPLGDLTPEQALCIDPATFALGGVIDGAVAPSEQVLVTGLGAIGLLVVQYCKARGATVFAASSLASRRQLAQTFGAAEVYDSQSRDDLARSIKERTGGVDVAIECSGRAVNLNRAIRATRQCGRVVCVGFYGADEAINLGQEFYHNRLTLLASLPALAWNNPVRGAKPLYAKDLQDMAAHDFRQGKIATDGIFDPVMRFEDAAEAVRLIADAPERVIKVMLTHTTN